MIALLVLPLGMSAQRITPEQLYSVVNQKQTRIDNIRQGVNDAYFYFDLDNAEATEYESGDYQAYIDFILARYNRTLSMMNYEAAKIAGEAASFIRSHHGDGTVSTDVTQAGIAKYTDMKEFFLKYAKEQNRKYLQFWQSYSAKHGNNGKELFQYDNEFMKRYGVHVQ